MLIELLEHDDELLQVAAAEALERLSNAGLREEVEMDVEDIFVPEPPEPDIGEPKPMRVVRMTSDPRDLPPEPSTETITRPSTNPARWQAWYEQNAAEWPLRTRYRLGQPYSPLVSLAELDTECELHTFMTCALPFGVTYCCVLASNPWKL